MFSITPKHEFLVGIDSDGCVFDSMELKHKECFIPAFINHYELQGVSKYAREAAEFVNLYSKSRGANRFPALVEQLDWLRRRPEVKARGVKVAEPEGLDRLDGTRDEARQSGAGEGRGRNGRPRPEAGAAPGRMAVNKAIAEMVRGVPPFPYVRECLERFAERGRHARLLADAQRGPRSRVGRARHRAVTCWRSAARRSAARRNRSPRPRSIQPNHTLMIGDAPGDYKAAEANNCLFFPINPGAEEASWQRLLRRRHRALLRRHVRRRLSEAAARRVRHVPAGTAAVASGRLSSHEGTRVSAKMSS